MLPYLANEMELGPSGVGLILSTTAVARLLVNLPFGRAADLLGRVPLMAGGQLATAAASVLTGLSTSLPALLACRLLLGAGSSAAMAGSQAYMADLTTSAPAFRARFIGFQSTAINLAYAV